MSGVTCLFQVGVNGDGTFARANAWNTFSDIRYKENFKQIDNPLSIVKNINGIYFNWKNDKSKTRDIGFIAQDVEKFLPEVVKTDKDGYKSLDYGKLTPLLIEAIKEQQKQIEELKKEIELLKKK